MRRHFRSPLARYGFSVLAVFAAANHLWAPAIFCTLIATYAWRSRHRRTRSPK